MTDTERIELQSLLDRARREPGTASEWQRLQELAGKAGWKVEPVK